MKRRSLSGFTLIELLVVIAIIGILAAVVLSSVRAAAFKSHDARRAEDLRTIQSALELYYSDNGVYPTNTTDNQGYFDSRDSTDDANSWTVFSSFLVPKYIGSLPIDPTNGQDDGSMTPGGNASEYYYHGFKQNYILSTYLATSPSWKNGSNTYGNFFSIVGGTCTKVVDFWDCQ